jgi:hypothetical protein
MAETVATMITSRRSISDLVQNRAKQTARRRITIQRTILPKVAFHG